MGTILKFRELQCFARRFGVMPKLTLVGRPDAGRGATMSPFIASSPLARMDK